MQQAILVFTSMPDRDSARTLAQQLVDRRLAACVNILSEMDSIYRWQDAIERATEFSMLIKTTRERYPELEALIKVMHPYDVPEIVAVPVSAGLPTYLAWVEMETRVE